MHSVCACVVHRCILCTPLYALAYTALHVVPGTICLQAYGHYTTLHTYVDTYVRVYVYSSSTACVHRYAYALAMYIPMSMVCSCDAMDAQCVHVDYMCTLCVQHVHTALHVVLMVLHTYRPMPTRYGVLHIVCTVRVHVDAYTLCTYALMHVLWMLWRWGCSPLHVVCMRMM